MVRDLLHRGPPALSVTILGSAGTYAHPDNPCSGYLLRTPDTAIWLDSGPGTFGALQRHVDLADLDAIVISHQHPDHWVELPVVRNAARYVLDISELAVYGTAGTLDLAEAVVGGPLDPTLRWTTVTNRSEVVVGDVALRFSRTDHPVETLAVRAESGGRVFGYSADTGPAWSFAALDPEGLGFDLVLCEATLAADDAGSVQHLTGRQAGCMAAAARAQRLALTHLYEGVGDDRADEASRPGAFDGPVEVANPGYTFTV